MAVGTGNIWRFPRIAATNSGDDGAGAFLVAWLVFLFLWSVPLIIAEYALGRKGRLGVIGTFTKLAGDRFKLDGCLLCFCCGSHFILLHSRSRVVHLLLYPRANGFPWAGSHV